MDCLKSTLSTLFEVPPAWCGKRVPQDNLKQKRAFVQLERLMQVKFKVREKGWVGEWRLMNDVWRCNTKTRLPSTTVEDHFFARLSRHAEMNSVWSAWYCLSFWETTAKLCWKADESSYIDDWAPQDHRIQHFLSFSAMTCYSWSYISPCILFENVLNLV